MKVMKKLWKKNLKYLPSIANVQKESYKFSNYKNDSINHLNKNPTNIFLQFNKQANGFFLERQFFIEIKKIH